jgi:hypothetical protein
MDMDNYNKLNREINGDDDLFEFSLDESTKN